MFPLYTVAKERQEQLAMLEGIKKALKGIENFSVESIGDIAYAMENKKKMKQLHAVLLITGIPLNIIQWVSIILWITTGIQWLFWGYILVAIPYAIFIIKCIVRNPRRRYSPHAGDFSPFTGFRLPFALHLTPSIVVTLNHSYTYRF